MSYFLFFFIVTWTFLSCIIQLEWYGSIYIYRRYPANSCSFRWSMFWPRPGGSATSMALQPFFLRESILTSLILVHADYLFCNWHSLNTNYYGTTFGGMPGSFNSSQINACVVAIGVLGPRFIVSSEGLGLHKMLPQRGFVPGTSRMPGKRCTTRLQLPL